MKIQAFEKELQEIDPDLAIRPNPPHPVFPELEKIASITYKGTDLFSVPNHDIYDETTPSYGVDVRGDGRFIAHRTRPEALAGVKDKLEQLKNPDYADAFFGRGEYSDAALRKTDTKGDVELVEEVTADLVEQGGSEDIKHPLIKNEDV